MKSIFTIIGARPQFIKASVVSSAIAAHNANISPDPLPLTSGLSPITEVILHTGQHFDANMSEVFFNQLGIPKPDIQLDIHGGNHGEMTGRMLIEIEKALLIHKPDRVLVYGDTNSTLAGALAAAKLNIPVAHVEAGLRSFNMRMPEEINRILTDRISDILFCPTKTAVKNLIQEGFDFRSNDERSTINDQQGLSDQPSTINHQPSTINHQPSTVYERPTTSDHPLVLNVGDVMQDSALMFAEHAVPPQRFSYQRDFILATLHRAENTDDPERLTSIVEALNHIHQRIAPVVLPLHPRTRNVIAKLGLKLDVSLIDPVGYFEMLWLLKHCGLVCTDSGGVQKEAFFFGKACVTMRDQTEWVELVEVGANELVGADKVKIITAAGSNFSRAVVDHLNLYGGGKAAERIVEVLANV